MHQLIFSAKFDRQLRKITKNNPELKKKIFKTLELLSEYISHSSLKLHKLSGLIHWSVSVSYSIRIIFHIKKNQILLSDIGPHDDVY